MEKNEIEKEKEGKEKKIFWNGNTSETLNLVLPWEIKTKILIL